MKEIFDKVLAWIKSNFILAIIIALVVMILAFGKQMKKLFGSPRRRRRRVMITGKTKPRAGARRGRFLPRSVGTRRARQSIPRSVGTSRKGYPAAGGGYIPFKYNKDGKVKQAKFVGGTVAAKNYMRNLRRKK